MGRLGAPSWGHFWHFWRPRWAKIDPKRVLEAYQHPKRDFSPNTRPRVPERHIGAQDASQNAPRSAQDGPKTVLKTIFFALENRLNFGLVLGPILVDFSLPNAPQKFGRRHPISMLKSFVYRACVLSCFDSSSRRLKRRPRGSKTPQEPPKRLQEAAKSAPRGSKRPPRAPQEAPR